MELQPRRIQELIDAVCTVTYVYKSRESDYHKPLSASGGFPAGFSEAVTIACNIHEFWGLVTTADDRWDPTAQWPRNLVINTRWSEEEEKARAPAMGFVRNLISDRGFMLRSADSATLNCLKSLRSLTVNQFNEEFDIQHLPFKQLTEITLNYSSTIGSLATVGAGVALVSFKCPKDNINYKDLSDWLQNSSQTLQHLEIGQVPYGFPLHKFPVLRSLKARFFKDYSMKMYEWSSLENLERLILSSNALTAPSYELLPTSITHLDLRMSDITDDAMSTIVQHLPKLQVIFLDMCTELTQAGYAHLEDCKALRSLHVGHAKFTDDMLNFFAASPFLSHRVTFMDISKTDCTGGALVAFLTACPNLRSVDIQNSTITASREVPELTLQVLSNCPNLQDIFCDGSIRGYRGGLITPAMEMPVPNLANHGPSQFNILDQEL